MNADFVPVALKAGLVNNPPNDEEGRLYREIVRSKVAPQGICVVNSAGKVLAWTAMFDDDKSVLDFLDHAARRFTEYPDARKLFPAERYLKYPSIKLEDVEDNGKVLPVPAHHAAGTHCPATPPMRKGTVLARLFGRALDKNGQPVADTLRQEHYVEDRFHVPVAMQEALAKALNDAGGDRFRLGDDLARLLVSHAYLGQLDVNPVSAPGGRGDLKQSEFWAQKVEGADDEPVRFRIEGRSEAVGNQGDGRGGDQRVDGRLWLHEVKLTWEGIIEMKKDRISRLLLKARGSEKLKWGNKFQEFTGEPDVTRLPAGHAIDLSCGVRYGIVGEPVPDEETGSAEEAGGAQGTPQEIPDEARKELVEALGGGPFLVFRNRVQEELKFTGDQKQKLLETFADHRQETMKVFERLQDLKAEAREKEMQSHRQKSHEKLVVLLKATLKAEQLQRLQQLELQQQGPFALGRPEIGKDLKITDAQQKQFMGVVQEMQKKIEPLLQAAQSGGNPQEIWPKIMKIRREHEGRIEAILSDAQKKQWKEMLAKPFDLDDQN